MYLRSGSFSVVAAVCTILMLISITGSDGAMECGVFSCPNLVTKAFDSITDSDSRSFCCKGLVSGLPYCCDWKDYGAYIFGLDPEKLQIPFAAILGLIIGGVVRFFFLNYDLAMIATLSMILSCSESVPLKLIDRSIDLIIAHVTGPAGVADVLLLLVPGLVLLPRSSSDHHRTPHCGLW
ncbi:hypothetical protein RvY_03909-1 [Ramazzottius varieornatus]|uniref:Uncharacterized protein n=1 Tax=Ramazzottius varieornatus TaxID=947166 RepID=A0A1D1UVD2_RAMVA|nr:hypothetical protein RvY_03909-1 [Ramazzottius varieornatus]